MIAVAIGTSVGMNSYMSRRLGEGNTEAASKGASNGLCLLLLSAIVFAIFGFVITPFFRLFTDDPQLIEMGVDYLEICMVFGLGVFIQIGCERILQSMGKTGLSMVTQLVGAVVNIILDPLMIFGIGPFPEMGVAGAAYATVIGQWVGMLMALALVFFKEHEVKISFKNFRLCGETVREIYRVGIPSIVMQSIGSIMNVGMNAIFSRILMSNAGIATFGVYFKVQSIVFMPLFGVTNASMTLCVTVIIMSIGTLLFQLFPQQIVSLFDSEGKITAEGIAAFRIISLHFPIAAASITISVTFQAIGHGIKSMFMSILRQLGVLLPAALVLALVFKSVESVWWCFVIAEFSAVTFGIISLTKIWRHEIEPMPDGAAV